MAEISCESCGYIGAPSPAGRCRNCSAQLLASAPEAPTAPDSLTPAQDLKEMPPAADLPAVEAGLRGLLLLAGEDPERLPGTPQRAVRALLGLTAGNDEDPAEILAEAPLHPPDCPPDAGRATLCAAVPLRTACEACMLPIFGEARLRCRTGERELDAGHLARLTRCLSRRLQTEPQLAEQIAAALVDLGGARSASAAVSLRRPCDDCGGGQAVTTARARRAAPAGGDPRRE